MAFRISGLSPEPFQRFLDYPMTICQRLASSVTESMLSLASLIASK